MQEGEEQDDDQPLSLAWPETCRKQATYLFILPIVFPLWLTLPDVRRDVSHELKSFSCHCISILATPRHNVVYLSSRCTK